MKVSLNWLKEYVSVDETPGKISQWLTDCGLEVEGLEKTESVRGGLKGVVIGEVLTCEKHPDADKLSLTTVDIGSETVPIVCGAPNVAKGQKVVVATEGATLYSPDGDGFKIKKVKIRGQHSTGMICAEDELGLGDNHDGIMVLDTSAKNGTPAADFFKVEEDYCIEIGLTPNRIDAASHLGVARDLVAVIKHLQPQKSIEVQKPDISNFKADSKEAVIRIIVEDAEACPRYSGLCISDVSITESPSWLKNRLKTIGLKPVNNLVDITNFVLHETGQPLHAFDADKITGHKVVIKKPVKGTRFVTLDEEEVELTGNDLMICNEETPMCIAGVLGGIDSGVTDETRNVFLESAYFDATTIRKTSKHHAINTDASFRFERGADPEMTIYALKRAALLIKEIAGGRITSEVMDAYPQPVKPNQIDFKYESADKLIGKVIERSVIKRILESLEIKVLKESDEGLLLVVPPYRVDVTRQADIVEEILRIYGYNQVELPDRLHSSIVESPKPDKERIQNLASDLLSARGFAETMNNSLTKASYFDRKMFDAGSLVHILNPLSQDLNVMRQTLFFGGLETIAWNQNRKIHDLKIYEFGNVYFKEATKEEGGKDKLPGYREQQMLAVFMTGNLRPESWYAPLQGTTLFDLKSEIVHLLKRLNIQLADCQVKELSDDGFLSAGLRYSLDNTMLFELGEVHPDFMKEFDLKQEVFFASVNWELVIQLTNQKPIAYIEIVRFPEVRRDLALLVEKNVRFSQIESLAFDVERKLLKSVRLFDVYQDRKIGDDKKSYAVSFMLQSNKKTLTDKEIDKVMDKISRTLQKELKAVIR